VSCSECLALVTAITFISIMMVGFGMGLCLSNSHTIFLLIPHFRFLNIRLEFILFFLQIHHLNFQQMSHNSPTPFPPHPLSNPPNIICCQHKIPASFSPVPNILPALSSLSQSPFSPLNYPLFHSHSNITQILIFSYVSFYHSMPH